MIVDEKIKFAVFMAILFNRYVKLEVCVYPKL